MQKAHTFALLFRLGTSSILSFLAQFQIQSCHLLKALRASMIYVILHRPTFFLDILIPDGQAKDLLTTVCQECEKVEQYEQYEAVYSWVDEQCPLAEAGNDVLSWCGSFLFEGKIGNSYDGAPYGACRPQFLDLWSTISKNIGSGMVAFLVFLLITILSACALTRRGNSTGTVQDKVPKEEGIEVVHGEFTQNGSTFQSDEEQQQHQTQIY
mmetsp:Transcript_37350/g.67167  ORF Transcript_37350/g.67167 Transcript_37350/m.67167 type:complete len:211 (+) Transcript_37350:470-1102(+)